jgi:hypothetical protein
MSRGKLINDRHTLPSQKKIQQSERLLYICIINKAAVHFIQLIHSISNNCRGAAVVTRSAHRLQDGKSLRALLSFYSLHKRPAPVQQDAQEFSFLPFIPFLCLALLFLSIYFFSILYIFPRFLPTFYYLSLTFFSFSSFTFLLCCPPAFRSNSIPFSFCLSLRFNLLYIFPLFPHLFLSFILFNLLFFLTQFVYHLYYGSFTYQYTDTVQ